MAASYPTSVKTFTSKVDGIDYVKAADVNSIQDEVNAVETTLGAAAQTSALPASAGTYSPSGINTTVSDRIKNLEAGLTGNATDGTRIGYTLLATGNLTSAPGAITVAGASYVKFVVVINVTTRGTGTAITLAINGATSSIGAYTAWAGTTTAYTGTTPFTLPITNAANPTDGYTVTAEIYNVNGTTPKTASWVNGTGYGFGQITNGTPGTAVTSLTIAATTYFTAATYTIYGVK